MITVIMTTYFCEDIPARRQYALATLDSILANLEAEEGLKLHLADDSPEIIPIAQELLDLATGRWNTPSTYTRSGHRGIGASLNIALDTIEADMPFLYITDDWKLVDKLNLDGPTRLVRAYEYDVVRLGPIHPDLHCITRFDRAIGWWLDLLPHYGGFAFATRPFIANKTFYTRLGPFDERLNSYETERLYAERVARSTAKLAYWGGVSLVGPFEHIGEESVGHINID